MIQRHNFEERLRSAVATKGLILKSEPDVLSALPYEQEIRIKTSVVDDHLEYSLGTSIPWSFIRSPRPRNYRTTSRRVVRHGRTSSYLIFANGAPSAPSALEPEEHGRVFAVVSKVLEDRKSAFGKVLQHVIVRGTYDEHVVIFNVHEIDANIVRSARTAMNAVISSVPTVRHVWLYVDPRKSRFYLDSDRLFSGVQQKRMMGESVWRQTVNGVTFQVGVFSFSQVNLSLLEPFSAEVVRLADVRPGESFADLYCGYGLFAAQVTDVASSIVAIDADATSVANARYVLQRRKARSKAVVARLTPNTLRSAIRTLDVAILDPPFAGPDAGVIDATAAFQPRRVVHVYCNANDIRRCTQEWKRAGYVPVEATAFDMFPGTLDIEVAVAYERKSQDEPATPRRPSRTTPRSGGRR
jgi:tRNA/tmRNA/rRNA uracil-C5-methylase (TrmA/RlmC/RlmD family)